MTDAPIFLVDVFPLVDIAPLANADRWYQHPRAPRYVMAEDHCPIARFDDPVQAQLVVKAQNALLAVLAAVDAGNKKLARLAANNERLKEALKVSRDQFSYYEGQHLAKGTPDADAKAEVNRDHVDRITRVLRWETEA